MNFLDNKKNSDENEEKEENKKIEFLKNLDDLDIGKPLKKENNFNFLKKEKGTEPSASASFLGEKKENGSKKISATNFLNQKSSAVPSFPAKTNGSLLEEEKLKSDNGGKFNFFKKRFKNKNGKDDVLEVNLVRKEIVKFFDWRKNVLILLICVFVSLFLVSVALWGISWWGNQEKYAKEDSLLQNYYGLTKQIKELEEKLSEVSMLRDKISAADFLLKKHIYWTNFFDFLEENTLANVYFAGFSGSTNGDYSFTAQTNDFNAIDAQVKKFLSNKHINKTEVTAGSISRGEGDATNVSFSLIFSLNPNIFLK